MSEVRAGEGERTGLLGGRADDVALIDAAGGAKVTYGELAARVDAAAKKLVRDAEGDVAFVFASNDVATVVELLAGFAARVPVALFDPRMADDVMDELRTRYRPGTIRGKRTPPETTGVAGQKRSTTTTTTTTPAGKGERAESKAAMHPELGLLLSTSGSTGSPKLVRLARGAVVANAKAIAETLALGPGEVAPTSLPLHYSYGLSVLSSHLAAGATVLLTNDGLLTEAFWTACRAHRVTSLAGVPYSYLMLRRIDLDRVAPPTLRTFTQAGGRLDPTLVRHYHAKAVARGGRLYVMYGQTEATARIAVLPPAELPARAGSVGRAIPGGSLTIDDGEVVYRGPNVMMGYALTRADLAHGDELGGELRTGDLGRLDDDGFLWITGRSRRIAKVFGLRVNLDELEALARAAADGLELAAIGDDDRVVVFLAGAGAASAHLAVVRAAITGRLGLHPTGIVVTAVAALPRLASGKIDYGALEVPS
jgi:acyl-coenzyme A synthetase/AMP-(fatty) acid ligase